MAVKGFAFVEYTDESGAKAAVAKAVEAEVKINPETKDPAELQTVVAYHAEQAVEKGLEKAVEKGLGKIDIKEKNNEPPKSTDKADGKNEAAGMLITFSKRRILSSAQRDSRIFLSAHDSH